MLTQKELICIKYIKRIRNYEKNRYAGHYFEHLRKGEPEPNEQEYLCSQLDKYAVRSQLQMLWF